MNQEPTPSNPTKSPKNSSPVVTTPTDQVYSVGPSTPPQNKPIGPFLILMGTTAAVVVMCYKVVEPMLIPLFLAAATAMLSYPWQASLTKRLGNRPYLSAAVISTLYFLVMVGPILTVILVSVNQVNGAVQFFHSRDLDPETLVDPNKNERIRQVLDTAKKFVTIDDKQFVETALTWMHEARNKLVTVGREAVQQIPQYVFAATIFIFGLYYFLADGARFIKIWDDISPLDAEHDSVLRHEFVTVTRAVVMGTVLAGMAQALVFGFGLALLDIYFRLQFGGWIILLMLATLLFALVPFVGAATVWLPTSIYLIAIGKPTAGIILMVFGATVVSTIDNFIKIYAIGNEANLHPLVVFVSVFGGIQWVGLIGVFVGPIMAAVLFAVLRILRRELIGQSKNGNAQPPPTSDPSIVPEKELA